MGHNNLNLGKMKPAPLLNKKMKLSISSRNVSGHQSGAVRLNMWAVDLGAKQKRG